MLVRQAGDSVGRQESLRLRQIQAGGPARLAFQKGQEGAPAHEIAAQEGWLNPEVVADYTQTENAEQPYQAPYAARR